MAGPTYFCWHCYQANDHPSGPCRACGKPVQPPAGATTTDIQLWALGHPLVERRMLAIAALGHEREPAAARPLRQLAEDADPYVAAAALEALVEIGGPETPALVDRLAQDGPAPVRAVADRLRHS